eukprot:GHVR01161099.1.p1 GENE.GHVR01161099.1~~GHVR01161099.1.p1  ORF type:complete len:529 (+),score=152.88 GHVR01161099.1:57-1589(+)
MPKYTSDNQYSSDHQHTKMKLQASIAAAESAITDRYMELKAKQEEIQKCKAEFEMFFSRNPKEMITMNVGGSKVEAMRGALTQFKQSGMAALFCGMYEKDVDKDHDGTMFLDLDPNAFNSLKEYLQAIYDGRAKIGQTDLMAPEDQHPNIDALIDHFKLRPYLTGHFNDDDHFKYKQERRKTLMGGPDDITLDEIAKRSQFLGPVIDEFTDMMKEMFKQEKGVMKLEDTNYENALEFDYAFAQLYKKKENDPIDYLNTLDTQFLVKRSTFKLSSHLYNMPRGKKGEVILTNPGNIIGKVLEYLRRRKIKLDNSHVGDLFINKNEYDFFISTMKSFNVLNDLQERAHLIQFNPNTKPKPLKLMESRAVNQSAGGGADNEHGAPPHGNYNGGGGNYGGGGGGQVYGGTPPGGPPHGHGRPPPPGAQYRGVAPYAPYPEETMGGHAPPPPLPPVGGGRGGAPRGGVPRGGGRPHPRGGGPLPGGAFPAGWSGPQMRDYMAHEQFQTQQQRPHR